MTREVKIQHLRSIFDEIVTFLNLNSFKYWIGGGLAEMISAGVVNDDAKGHDIDFHVLEAEHERLKESLLKANCKIKQDKVYKIRLFGDNEQRGIEFVFLKSDAQNYTFKSRNIDYILPQQLFGNSTIKIKDKAINIPDPIEEYVAIRKQQKAECKARL